MTILRQSAAAPALENNLLDTRQQQHISGAHHESSSTGH
jgi:hypothetical protein